MDNSLCPICKSSLYQDAPSQQNQTTGSTPEKVPEHLQNHRCCATRCGHLLHTVCLARKRNPGCPVCSKELTINEVHPLRLPTQTATDGARWIQYPKFSGDYKLLSVLRKISTEPQPRPIDIFPFYQGAAHPGGHFPVPVPQNVSEKSRPPALIFPFKYPPGGPPGGFPPTSNQTRWQKLDTLLREVLGDEPLSVLLHGAVALWYLDHYGMPGMDELLAKLEGFAEEIKQVKENGSNILHLLPRLVNWLLSLNPEEVRRWLSTWNGHIGSLHNFLDGQDLQGEPTTNSKPYLLASLPELMTACQNIGAVDFFRLTLLYDDLNRGGLLDSTRSGLEALLPRVAQILRYNENILRIIVQCYTRETLDVLASDGVKDRVHKAIDWLEYLMNWLTERGWLE